MHANMQAEIQLKNKNLKKILDLKSTSWTILFEKGGNVHDDRKNDNIK